MRRFELALFVQFSGNFLKDSCDSLHSSAELRWFGEIPNSLYISILSFYFVKILQSAQDHEWKFNNPFRSFTW